MGTEHPTRDTGANDASGPEAGDHAGTGTTTGEERPALGQPAGDPTDTSMGEPDIAGEHEDTAVDKNITAGTDGQRESESPDGWGGMEGA